MKKIPQMDVIFILKFNETPLIQKKKTKKNELNNCTQVKYHHLNLVNMSQKIYTGCLLLSHLLYLYFQQKAMKKKFQRTYKTMAVPILKISF